MSGFRWLRLSDEEMNAFLGNGGTGTLSFSTSSDEPPFSLPVSYGYDTDTAHFHYRLALPSGSTKEKFLDRPVSFVTHSRTNDGWRSVIAVGALEDLTELPYEAAARQERWAVDIPFVDIFEESPDDVTFNQFRLVPDELTGRKGVSSPD
ncbi:pyridoxamine 5'-phosphate oxidase family protein [Halococcus thailandensis]|uniref:Flavin-nucleotide-binding protein-like protein n=1 Tax=Halococcus thailandensis JCM 13552 TaxID=1227457 RepID=M0NHL4_9EURY|nr:pyridoxamine 5'-phosphate oxidase family protein [Halococcus thailandensis]EMA56145.1 flavin-nucleotide-binding protein-like protein [Halococcus thailandensis JCM 13552]